MYGTFLAVLLALLAAATAYLGVHLTLHPPITPKHKRAYKLAFIVCGLVSVVLIGLQTRQNEREFKQLPRDVAEYIKNTMPPGTFFAPKQSPPAPPTGLIAVIKGDEGKTVLAFASQLQDFLRKQGAPPKQANGESDLDYLVRSNAWYSRVMAEYNKTLANQVANLVNLLVEKKILAPQVADLAKNPVNLLGIKELATQLDAAKSRFAEPQE